MSHPHKGSGFYIWSLIPPFPTLCCPPFLSITFPSSSFIFLPLFSFLKHYRLGCSLDSLIRKSIISCCVCAVLVGFLGLLHSFYCFTGLSLQLSHQWHKGVMALSQEQSNLCIVPVGNSIGVRLAASLSSSGHFWGTIIGLAGEISDNCGWEEEKQEEEISLFFICLLRGQRQPRST